MAKGFRSGLLQGYGFRVSGLRALARSLGFCTMGLGFRVYDVVMPRGESLQKISTAGWNCRPSSAGKELKNALGNGAAGMSCG